MTTIAITGAGRGIGLELTRQYAATGDTVIALCRDPSKAKDLADLAAGSGGKVSVQAMDVADDASVKTAASSGSGSIDVLINVAGVIGGEKQGLGDADWAAWHDAFNVMTIGPLRVAQAFLPRMAAGSKIITVTSQLGASTWPYGGFYSYGAAKAAVNRVMRSLAIDLKDRGILVGLVHPGWVKTDMGGPGADIEKEESASGIRAVTAGLTPETSGEFFKWNGEKHAW